MVVAFTAGNLKAVARMVRERYPEREIILAGDDDHATPGNPGASKARAAAMAVEGKLALPVFAQPGDGTDFNDLHQADGLEAVRRQVEEAQEPKPDQETVSNPHEQAKIDRNQGHEKRPPQADILLTLAESLEVFHTADGQAFARVPSQGHLEVHGIKGRGFKQWLGRQFYEHTQKAPSSQALQDALNVIEAKALFGEAEREVFVRLGHQAGRIYLDLGSTDWSAIEVDAQGWRLVVEPPVMFRRPAGLLPLPVPQSPGNLGLLRQVGNLRKRDSYILAVAWLVGALHPYGPYLALALQGEQGSGKSLTARLLRQVIDPSQGDLRAAPHNERDLMIAAANGWVVAFDNLSGVPTWLSDALCRIATGGALSARTLYCDREETILEAKRPLLLNGIATVASRHDLVDRAIILSLPTIPEDQRRSESEIWQDFESAHPSLLAGLLDAVSAAIRNKGKVSLTILPRMADAALWVAQAEEALPWKTGAFLAAYRDNRDRAVAASLEADQVAVAILALMEHRDSWEGTASDLLEALSNHTSEQIQKSKYWPKAANQIAGRLTRVATFLRQAAGLECTTGERIHGGRRILRINKKNAVTPVTPVTKSTAGGDEGDEGDSEFPAYSNDTQSEGMWTGPAEVIL